MRSLSYDKSILSCYSKRLYANLPNYHMLKVQGLSYELNDNDILRGISFSLRPADILLIVGSNGIGKTTLTRLICGLIRSTAGQVLWRNRDIFVDYSQYLSELQYIGHTTGSKADLTVEENLLAIQALASQPIVRSIAAVVQEVGLAGYETTYVKHLSAGQRRRLLLTRLIMFESKLWILDEPFVTLDNEGKELLHHLIAEHSQKKGITLLTSHGPMEVAGMTPKTCKL